MTYVLDASFLKDGYNRFVVKEMAIIKLGKSQITESFIFRPPFEEHYLPKKVRQQNKWITDNIHGLSWDDGYVEYKDLGKIIGKLQEGVKVYGKGQKAQILGSMFKIAVHDLESIGCPKAENISLPPIRCHMGNHVSSCCLYKGLKYATWLNSYVQMEVVNQQFSNSSI
jgi:hypothetical protein